ncbi:MAG: hypothetical protein KAT16_06355 [Candidatus Heimdallarchaeota archaeon]|nr:hypothetical protein [Candidatus Heimdallarchaeota archaeon]
MNSDSAGIPDFFSVLHSFSAIKKSVLMFICIDGSYKDGQLIVLEVNREGD